MCHFRMSRESMMKVFTVGRPGRVGTFGVNE